MEELKESTSYKDVELLSEEVQEVMSRIPSAIVRWGMTVMAIIVVGMLIVAAYVPWPRTIEYPFEGHHDGAKALINVTLTDAEGKRVKMGVAGVEAAERRFPEGVVLKFLSEFNNF